MFVWNTLSRKTQDGHRYGREQCVMKPATERDVVTNKDGFIKHNFGFCCFLFYVSFIIHNSKNINNSSNK